MDTDKDRQGGDASSSQEQLAGVRNRIDAIDDRLLELLNELLHGLFTVLEAENSHYFILSGYLCHYAHLLLDHARQLSAGKDNSIAQHDTVLL